MSIRVSRMRKRAENRPGVSQDNKRVALATISGNVGLNRTEQVSKLLLLQRSQKASLDRENQVGCTVVPNVAGRTIVLPHEMHGLGGLPMGTRGDVCGGSESKDGQIMTMASRTGALSLLSPCTAEKGSPMTVPSSSETDMNMSVLPAIDETNSPNNTSSDSRSVSSIFKCPEYSSDILNYMFQQEQRFMAKPDYMRKQPDITHAMRAILVDWLVEVAEEYKLRQHTLYLTVSYVDRFLSKMSVLRGKLQLVGAASMLVAAKFEEIHPPEVDEFVYITDDTYTRRQIIKMEFLLLKILSFDLSSPTSLNFLEYFFSVSETEERTEHLAKFLIQLTLLEADPYLKYLPSVIAASAVALSRHTHGLPAWTPELELCSGCTIVDIQDCIQNLHYSFSRASRLPQQAIQEKFTHAKFSRVAKTTPPSTLPF
eukprot:m.309598 g.309598  ORF g.309598 m.309598 type:complete len:427 (+) comp47065_c0_seq1:216-1496(+)